VGYGRGGGSELQGIVQMRSNVGWWSDVHVLDMYMYTSDIHVLDMYIYTSDIHV